MQLRYLLMALATLALSQASWADHAWSTYHWERASNPVAIDIGDNVDSTWKGFLGKAINDWDTPNPIGTYEDVLNLKKVVGNTSPKPCKATDGMVEVCNDNYGNNGWLGIAQIWITGDHIGKGVVKVNDYYHDQSRYSTDDWKQLVMCQEIGHTFGLGHQNEDFNTDETMSCMEYTALPQDNVSPDWHDYEMLETIYEHLDVSTSGDGGGTGGSGCGRPGKCKNGASAPPAFDMPLPSIDQWGEKVHTSDDGGQSVFVQDFGQGYRVITHVTWTLEKAEKNRHEHEYDH